MMFSRGCINGDVMNAYPIAGGPFVEELSASGSIAIAWHANALRRVQPSAISNIAMTGNALARKVSHFSAVGSIAIGSLATALRLVHAGADGTIVIESHATAMRRVRLSALGTIQNHGVAYLRFRKRFHAAPDRSLEQPPHDGAIAVPAERARTQVPVHRGEVVVARGHRTVRGGS